MDGRSCYSLTHLLTDSLHLVHFDSLVDLCLLFVRLAVVVLAAPAQRAAEVSGSSDIFLFEGRADHALLVVPNNGGEVLPQLLH